MLLERAGYVVCSLPESSMTPDLNIPSFDLVLLCHSISLERAESLAGWIRPRIPHVAVVRLASFNPDRKPCFDAVCSVQYGPVPLLTELDNLRKLRQTAA